MMVLIKLRTISLVVAATLLLPPPAQGPLGNAVIRGKAGPSEIVITTTARVAGAIHSLTWNGKEFIDSHDHGRQMQSAVNLDCGKDFIPEVFNPTEAGSSLDGKGETSSSKLLRSWAAGSELRTTTRMAFWLAPGEKSSGNAARNGKALSDHLVSKRVRIGCQDIPADHVRDLGEPAAHVVAVPIQQLPARLDQDHPLDLRPVVDLAEEPRA